MSSTRSENIPHEEWICGQELVVVKVLEKHFGNYLRKRRGKMTFAAFSRKTGLPPSTLHRLESGEQSITPRAIGVSDGALEMGFEEIFPREWVKGKKGDERRPAA